MKTFEELGVCESIRKAIDELGFVQPMPVQEAVIPFLLENQNDVIALAQTGTGKTAAYLLPILSLLADGDYPKDAINCVIMSPTRELAQQIDSAMQGFAYYLDDVSSVAVYGGNDGIRYEQEKRAMQSGADVVIATPGRLISHLSLGNIDLSKVSFFILDEADRMLDMGFCDDILLIAKALPKEHQTIMFSATMPGDILNLAHSILRNPVEVKLAVSKPADNIRQSAYLCYEPQKLLIVKHMFEQEAPQMHSDLLQAERDEVMHLFRSGKVDVLVATDIVARGIDIDDIAIVINFDVPRDEEDYVHRIGRTARAGRGGRAVTLVNEKDMHFFRQIERFLGKEIHKEQMPAELGEGPAYTARSKAHGAKGKRRWGRKPNPNRGKGKEKGKR